MRLSIPVLVLSFFIAVVAHAQQVCMPRMEQDWSLNNLVHAEGTVTCEPGTLGRVDKVGTGPLDMILIAGDGFGGDVFEGFMEKHADEFTMYAVTLAGFEYAELVSLTAKGTTTASISLDRLGPIKASYDTKSESRFEFARKGARRGALISTGAMTVGVSSK